MPTREARGCTRGRVGAGMGWVEVWEPPRDQYLMPAQRSAFRMRLLLHSARQPHELWCDHVLHDVLVAGLAWRPGHVGACRAPAGARDPYPAAVRRPDRRRNQGPPGSGDATSRAPRRLPGRPPGSAAVLPRNGRGPRRRATRGRKRRFRGLSMGSAARAGQLRRAHRPSTGAADGPPDASALPRTFRRHTLPRDSRDERGQDDPRSRGGSRVRGARTRCRRGGATGSDQAAPARSRA